MMIRIEHIKIFNAFKGDIDDWARMKKPGDAMTDEVWLEIETIIQKLILIKKGFAAKEFTSEIFQKLKKICENTEVEQALISMSNKR